MSAVWSSACHSSGRNARAISSIPSTIYLYVCINSCVLGLFQENTQRIKLYSTYQITSRENQLYNLIEPYHFQYLEQVSYRKCDSLSDCISRGWLVSTTLSHDVYFRLVIQPPADLICTDVLNILPVFVLADGRHKSSHYIEEACIYSIVVVKIRNSKICYSVILDNYNDRAINQFE